MFTAKEMSVNMLFLFFKKTKGELFMSVKPEEIVATTQTSSDVLGHLFWFSIGKQIIPVNELERKLIDSGVGKEWMPNRIRSVDAFRRATREIQTKRPTQNPKVFKNYLVREVFSDNDYIQRNLVVETVDQTNKKLGYEAETAILKLDKKNDVLVFSAFDSDAMELCQKAEEKFSLYRHHYSSQHIRVMVAKILNSLAPTPMRKKGIIYFIPFQMTQKLTNLVNFIMSLENSEAFKVPVINSKDNREMVSKKLSDYIDQLLMQCRDSSGLRDDQVKALIEETNRVITDYKKYKELVQNEAEFFERKIMTLRAEVLKIIQE